MAIDDNKLGRLLSGRDEPSVLETEPVLEAVLRNVAAPPRRRLWPAWFALAGVAAAAVLALRPSPEADYLGARGAHEEAVLAIRCADDGSALCQAGSGFGLELQAPPGRPYFALFAVRPDRAVVWFVPARDQSTPSVAAQRAGLMWTSVPRLPDDSPTGDYRLLGVFSASPLTRDQLKQALGDDLRGDGTLHVVERVLKVRP